MSEVSSMSYAAAPEANIFIPFLFHDLYIKFSN